MNCKNPILFVFFYLFVTSSALADTTLVKFGSAWQYLDNGSNQGTAWRTGAVAWPGATLEVAGHGNCLASMAAQLGLALEELSEAELDVHDPRFPVRRAEYVASSAPSLSTCTVSGCPSVRGGFANFRHFDAEPSWMLSLTHRPPSRLLPAWL